MQLLRHNRLRPTDLGANQPVNKDGQHLLPVLLHPRFPFASLPPNGPALHLNNLTQFGTGIGQQATPLLSPNVVEVPC